MVSRSEFAQEVEEGRIAFKAKDGTRIWFDGFGSTEVKEGMWWIEKEAELLKEVDNILAQLAGEKGCRGAMEVFRAEPTDESREHLRQAYLAVPAHERMYLGDMDVKDAEFRRILESDNENG